MDFNSNLVIQYYEMHPEMAAYPQFNHYIDNGYALDCFLLELQEFLDDPNITAFHYYMLTHLHLEESYINGVIAESEFCSSFLLKELYAKQGQYLTVYNNGIETGRHETIRFVAEHFVGPMQNTVLNFLITKYGFDVNIIGEDGNYAYDVCRNNDGKHIYIPEWTLPNKTALLLRPLWSLANQRYYPEYTEIFTTILLLRNTEGLLIAIPREIIYIIFSWIVKD